MELEALRLLWLRASILSWAALAGMGLVSYALYLSWPNDPRVCGGSAAVTVIFGFILFGVAKKRRGMLHRQFNAWRDRAIAFIDAEASLQPNQGIKQAAFDDSWLISAFYNRYYGSNYFRVGNVECSNLSLKHEYQESYTETVYETDSQGRQTSRQVTKTRTVIVPIYDGFFMATPAQLPHPGSVILRHTSFGLPNGLFPIHVASPHLKKTYAVGATEQFLGYRTMTPKLMVALWEFCTQFKHPPGYSYRGNVLYITLPGFFIGFGVTPGRWRAITLTTLRKVYDDCAESINFAKTTANKLQPD
jgi:hypothetical protein